MFNIIKLKWMQIMILHDWNTNILNSDGDFTKVPVSVNCDDTSVCAQLDQPSNMASSAPEGY